jgi:hypothetical protein
MQEYPDLELLYEKYGFAFSNEHHYIYNDQ